MNEIINVEAKDVTKEYEEAVLTHQRIMANGEVCVRSLLAVCQDLKKMRDKQLYEQLGYDTFDNYCEGMAGIKARMAYNYISTYERLGASFLQSNANLGITKLSLIAGMNPEERADKLESGELLNMSVAKIKELIKKNKEQGEQISLLQEQLDEANSEESAEDPETDKLKERIKELEEQISENSEYDTEKDEMYERIKTLENELRQKDSAHKIELENLSEKISGKLREELKSEIASEQPEQDNSEEIKKQVDAAVAAAKKETEKEVKAKLKDKSDKQAEKIKELEAVLSASASEKEKLQKQLALSDTKSAKAMVYIDSLQNSFNALFGLISEMDKEQQNKFKGAVLKLTSAMQKKAEE